VGANILTQRRCLCRGDENNQDVNGQLPGYTVVNVDGHYQVSERFEVFGRANNLLDRRYFNFGVVGENFFTGPGRTFGPVAGTDPRAEQFRGRRCSVGLVLGVAVFLWIRRAQRRR